jgi:hypothetical protein
MEPWYQWRDAIKNNSKMLPTTPESQPALPFYLVLEIPKYESPFDNSLVRKLLDYQPEESSEDALEWIALEYRTRHPHSSKKLPAQHVASRQEEMPVPTMDLPELLVCISRRNM